MKKLYIFLIASILFSCKSPLDKSIVDTLTVEEIKKGIDKDSLFRVTYESIADIKEKHLKNDLEKARFYELT